jgi:hypothetical protein
LAINEQVELFNGGFKLGDWFENKGYFVWNVSGI